MLRAAAVGEASTMRDTEEVYVAAQRVASRLDHVAGLALIALSGSDPESGVDYLLIALEDVSADVELLRRAHPAV